MKYTTGIDAAPGDPPHPTDSSIMDHVEFQRKVPQKVRAPGWRPPFDHKYRRKHLKKSLLDII
jgi:hypothetical protein